VAYRRFHIPTANAPSKARWSRVNVVRDFTRCLNCGTCIDSCLYGVHSREGTDERYMDIPESYLCRVCFRCVQECPVNALTLEVNLEYKTAGNGLFTPETIRTLEAEAETGRIPVSGAAYRGPFGGPGFDGMWTDMSEIVRPTRDGIHGREFISTSVDIGRKPNHLDFSADGAEMRPPREIPVPFLFDLATPGARDVPTHRAVAAAVKQLESLMIVSHAAPPSALETVKECGILRLDGEDPRMARGWAGAEVDYASGIADRIEAVRSELPDGLVSLRVMMEDVTPEVGGLALDHGVDIVHFTTDWQDLETIQGIEEYITRLRSFHLSLVKAARRDELTILASGPIAMAEHVPKTIILGADAVGVDLALFVAMEVKPPNRALRLSPFRDALPPGEEAWAAQRILNLMNSWRDQLLEVLGAMGMREVRRLRGDVGRSIFQRDAEKEAFADIKVRRAAS